MTVEAPFSYAHARDEERDRVTFLLLYNSSKWMFLDATFGANYNNIAFPISSTFLEEQMKSDWLSKSILGLLVILVGIDVLRPFPSPTRAAPTVDSKPSDGNGEPFAHLQVTCTATGLLVFDTRYGHMFFYEFNAQHMIPMGGKYIATLQAPDACTYYSLKQVELQYGMDAGKKENRPVPPPEERKR